MVIMRHFRTFHVSREILHVYTETRIAHSHVMASMFVIRTYHAKKRKACKIIIGIYHAEKHKALHVYNMDHISRQVMHVYYEVTSRAVLRVFF